MISLICLCLFSFDQAQVDDAMSMIQTHYDAPQYLSNRTGSRAGWYNAGQNYYAGTTEQFPGRADIIVGDEPSETLSVTGYFYNNGNIFVINNGVVQIDHADFNLDGNIVVMDHGAVYVDSS